MGKQAGVLSRAGPRHYGKQHPTTRRQGNGEHLVTITSGLNVDDTTFDYFLQAAKDAQHEAEQQRQAVLEQYQATLRNLGELSTRKRKSSEAVPATTIAGVSPNTMDTIASAGVRRLRVWGGAVLRG